MPKRRKESTTRQQRDAIRALRLAVLAAHKLDALKLLRSNTDELRASLDATVEYFNSRWQNAPGPDLVSIGVAMQDWNNGRIYFGKNKRGHRAFRYRHDGKGAIPQYSARVWKYFDGIDQFAAAAREFK